MPIDAYAADIKTAQQDPLKVQQDRLWYKFRQMLEDLRRDELGLDLTYDHIAKGLDLSRQRLYKFMKEPEQGLPIQRYNVLKLWEYITDPDSTSAQLSAAARQKRQALRQREPRLCDRLLEAAGFLPTGQMNQGSSAQVMRVQRRLTSPLISDSQIGDITDTILNVISDKGAYLLNTSEAGTASDHITADQARFWPQNALQVDAATPVAQSYQQTIDRFVKLGKLRFCPQELFELYQGIDENHALNLDTNEPKAIDCELQTVSILLRNLLHNPLGDRLELRRDLEKRLEVEYDTSEHWLRTRQPAPQQQDGKTETNGSVPAAPKHFPPVIDALATFYIAGKSGNLPSDRLPLTFRYASSSTHVEAVLIAVSDGMGSFLSPTSLTMDRLQVKSLGESSESLVRVSVTLAAKAQGQSAKTYQGLWVEQNTILGILQATTQAATSWFERYLGSTHLQTFYQLCERASQVQRSLDSSVVQIFNAREFGALSTISHAFEFERVKDTIEQDVVKALQTLTQDFRALLQSPLDENRIPPSDEQWYRTYCQEHQVKLDRKNLLARVTLAYAQLTSDRPLQARETLDDLNNKLYRGDFEETTNPRFASMTALYVSARTHYRIMVGSPELDKLRQRLPNERVTQRGIIFEDFREYTQTVRQGVIDFEVYLAAGSFCAAMALISFYYATPANTPNVDVEVAQAIDLFLRSSHYAAKIGYRQQATRHLCFASRLSARMGTPEYHKDAVSLLSLGRRVIDSESLSLKPASFTLYLTQAEIYLLSQPKPHRVDRADLLNALTCALYACKLVRMPRIDPDQSDQLFSSAQVETMYALYRVLDALSHGRPSYTLEALCSELGEPPCAKVPDGMIVIAASAAPPLADELPPLVKDVPDPQLLLKELLKDLLCIGNFSCAQVVDILQKRLVGQLNRWHRAYRGSSHFDDPDGAEHPMAEAVRKKSFLGRLS
ncbi:MAG: hypothetical protein ACFB4J_11235 [Elainellaceae cyanobacterium]